jgi:sialate O-acetylesterase
MKHIIVSISLVLAFLSCTTQEDIKLIGLFSDNMVLQQDSEVPIFGKAKPHSKIKIETSWGENANGTVSADGTFNIKIKALEADLKPHTLTISSKGQAIELKNIMFGEVWVCSGQSNMEMPVKGFMKWDDPGQIQDTLYNWQEEISEANYPNIRLFTVTKRLALLPKDTLSGKWEVCSPSTIPDFSAVAYFFGRKLHKELNIPIGLIHSSWSGSPAQSWVASDFIKKIEEYEETNAQIASLLSPDSKFNKWIENRNNRPVNDFVNKDTFVHLNDSYEKVKNAGYDDSKWQSIEDISTFSGFFKGREYRGASWFRQSFTFEEITNSDNLKLNFGRIDGMNAIYINGELLGRFEKWGQQKEKKYDIPSGLLKQGKNTIAIRVLNPYSKGGIGTGTPLSIMQGDDVVSTLDNGWKYKISAVFWDNGLYVLDENELDFVEPEPDRLSLNSHTPTVLFNAMINPLIPYTIKGGIWYQGESNANKGKQYQTLFPAVFESWRTHWGIGDFPFYYVQLATFNGTSGAWGELREAQLLTLKKKNTGMAVAMDVGNPRKIHPGNKQPVGERLALWALAKDYGKEIVYSGPLYNGVNYTGNKAVISFTNIGSGLSSPDENLKYFEIAGADEIFYPAAAHIDGDNVIVFSNQVKSPKIVRYAWFGRDEASLFNKEGLPASPFRTALFERKKRTYQEF